MPYGSDPLRRLRGFAEHQPVTSVTETMRGLLLETSVGDHAPTAVIWFAGLTVGGYLVAVVIFGRTRRD